MTSLDLGGRSDARFRRVLRGSDCWTWLLGVPGGGKHAALDRFRGYAELRDGLGDAAAVLDASDIVKLGTQVMDEVAAASNTIVRRSASGVLVLLVLLPTSWSSTRFLV